MRKLTHEIYETLKSEIRNEDVPMIFHSMLFKQCAEIQQCKNTFSHSRSSKVDLFLLFFRQYNTILVLSRGISHIGYPDRVYLDITSVNVLIRCCHERFLAFWYLTSQGVFPNASLEDEAEFKWLCYYHCGAADAVRSMELQSVLVDTTGLEKSRKGDKRAKHDLLLKIKSHRIFSQLPADVQKQIERHGAWKIGSGAVMSWYDLAKISPLKSALAQWEYHTMSLYAHSGYSGVALDKQHDGNIDSLLAYLYVLAASYINTLDSIFPDFSNSFTSRELACLQEFVEIAKNSIEVQPLSELDE